MKPKDKIFFEFDRGQLYGHKIFKGEGIIIGVDTREDDGEKIYGVEYELGGKKKHTWITTDQIIRKMSEGGEFPGGLLVGETDKNGERGIAIVAPEGNIRVGGGETVVVSDASKAKEKYDFEGEKKTPCEIISDINHKYGGVKIPCDIAEAANTTDSKKEVGDVIKRAENGMKVSSGFTPVEVINAGWRKIKEKLGEKKAHKYFDQANRLMDPNQNNIVEYRTNSIVVKEGDKYMWYPFIGTDYKKWWLGEKSDISEQFNTTAESGTKIYESTEDKIQRLKSDYNNVFSREGDSQYARLLKKKISFLKGQLNKNYMKAGGKTKDEKNFIFKDKSGGGRKPSKLSESHIRATWDLDETDDEGVSLKHFLNNSEPGDVWRNEAEYLENISEVEMASGGKTGEYQVKYVGKRYFVIYKFSDGEEMVMSDPYGTEAGAEKAKERIMSQAGVLKQGSMAMGGEISEGDFIKKSTGSGGVKYNTEGFVYEKSGDRVKLKDAYGNKSEQWYDLSGFRKKNPPMASGGAISDLEKAKLKYAKQDINLLEKEHNIAITDTEHGVLWGSHKDGVFEFSTANGTNLFKGNKNQAIEFVKNSYTAEGMAGGGKTGKSSKDKITLYHFFGGFLRKKDGGVFPPFPNVDMNWTDDKEKVERLYGNAGVHYFDKGELMEINDIPGVLLFEIQSIEVPKTLWTHRESEAIKRGYGNNVDEMLSDEVDYNFKEVKERAIHFNGEIVGEKELKEYIHSMKSGGQIHPLKKVKANQGIAISEVLKGFKEYRNLSPLEASFLYNLRNKDVAEESFHKREGLSGSMFKSLDEKGYLGYNYDKWNPEFTDWAYEISDDGWRFIQRVNNRIETRKGVKSGVDLFPETSNIPELSMAGGGMIYIYKQKEYTPGELIDLASTTSLNKINSTRDAIHTLGIENVAIKGLGKNKEYWVGAFEQGGTTADSGDAYYIERDKAKGFNVYESYYKKKGDKDWTKYILLSNPDLTEKQAISSAQSNFIYNSGVKLNYPREVKELYDWKVQKLENGGKLSDGKLGYRDFNKAYSNYYAAEHKWSSYPRSHVMGTIYDQYVANPGDFRYLDKYAETNMASGGRLLKDKYIAIANEFDGETGYSSRLIGTTAKDGDKSTGQFVVDGNSIMFMYESPNGDPYLSKEEPAHRIDMSGAVSSSEHPKRAYGG